MKREITIYDIAKELNVSSSTVSRALQDHPEISQKTISKVKDTAEKLGYRHNTFASNLRTRKTYTIGVLVHELQSNFMVSVLAGIEKVTSEAGYDLIIAHSSESFDKEAANAKNLFHKRVDGLFVSLSLQTTNLKHFKAFQDKNIPIMFFDRVDENSDATKIVIDNYRCGYQATSHLIEQGCKRIVMVTSDLRRNVYAQRHKGYQDALFDHKIAYDSDLVLIKDLSEEGGRTSALEILKKTPFPDGAFITNDFTAAVCLQTLKEHGVRIPEDIAIVGFNNDKICKFVDPNLTTINYPGFDMGVIAAKNMIQHLEGKSAIDTTSKIVIHSELIVRESSRRKKG
ncbi:MAG: LacI family DNA-binding transcriptional regulator [Chitinophagaceae bacterium]